MSTFNDHQQAQSELSVVIAHKYMRALEALLEQNNIKYPEMLSFYDEIDHGAWIANRVQEMQ